MEDKITLCGILLDLDDETRKTMESFIKYRNYSFERYSGNLRADMAIPALKNDPGAKPEAFGLTKAGVEILEKAVQDAEIVAIKRKFSNTEYETSVIISELFHDAVAMSGKAQTVRGKS